jgi:micrococcal nuclease
MAMALAGCAGSARPGPPSPTSAPAAPSTARPSPTPAPAAPAAAPGPPRDDVRVIRVIDGDTIEVAFGHGAVATVRYIGVDTPETVDPNRPAMCFGTEATTRNAELVGGRPVQLERDVSETDRYGRLLRYVWVTGPDGATRMANEELVKWGYAQSSTYPPDVKYQPLFVAAQREAQAEKRGLWGACSRFGEPAATPTAAPPARPAPPTPAPAKAVAPTPQPAAPAQAARCDPSYPDFCIPPAPPDLDCGDIPRKRFTVRPPDPHRLDADRDGIGCES